MVQLKSLVDDKIILDVRGRGLLFAIDQLNERVGDEIFSKLIDRGYILCNRRSLFRIDPPLIITEQEFDEFIQVFEALLHKIKNKNGIEQVTTSGMSD